MLEGLVGTTPVVLAEAQGGGFLAAVQILLTHGGVFPYLNIVSTAAALAIIIERTIALQRYGIASDKFMADVLKSVREGQIDRAVRVCSAAPNSILARVMKAGLTHYHKGEMVVDEMMEEESLAVTPLVAARIPMLFPLANIATLIGLVGTISGLIKAFSALASASPEQKSLILATGISEAMYNTAFGLLIAVTCLIAQLLLATKQKHMTEDLDVNSKRLSNVLKQLATHEAQV